MRPGAIVGALANEGGLSSKDFGRITIAVGHTLVDLPKNLDRAVLDRLKDTRISGQLINIAKDTGRPPMAMTVADAAAVVATAMIVAEAVGAVTTVADAVAVVATVTVMTVAAVGATKPKDIERPPSLSPSFK